MTGPAVGASAFSEFVRLRVSPALRALGFARRGHRFARWVGRNCELVDFQRSPHSTDSRYEFYVNLGVLSGAIYVFELGVRPPTIPSAEAVHWSIRLGRLLPRRVDWGWAIENTGQISDLATEVVSAIESHGILWLDKHISDQDLLEVWSRMLDTHATGDIRPLLRLSVLAKSLAQDERSQRAIEKAIETCRGLPCERTVVAHIAKLENWRVPRAFSSQAEPRSRAVGRSNGKGN